MDEIVKLAMAKWPTVPDCLGWLGLDVRGQWCLRDDRTQALGAFASGVSGAKGSVLQHAGLVAFIGRNYQCDARGCWYFQNGPQRVYVELELCPWVWRLQPDGQVQSHTGQTVVCSAAWMDEAGWLYLESPLGLGLVHSADMELAAQALDAQRWPLHTLQRAELAQRFGYVRSPQALLQGAL